MPIVWVKPTIESHKEKFLARVKRNKETGCLEWQGGLATTGYGQFSWGNVDGGPANTTAHRASWWLFKGPVPDGLYLLHKCHNRKCVEVEREGHVYAGTQQQNMTDMVEAERYGKKVHHYDWRKCLDLKDRIMAELNADKTVDEVCLSLDIGRTTFYRLRDYYPEIRSTIEANKRWHRQRGARKGKHAKWRDELMPSVLTAINLGGNISEVSKRVGVNPATLRKWSHRFPEIAEALAGRPMAKWNNKYKGNRHAAP